MTTGEAWFDRSRRERAERRLRELASDNADAVERGDMTAEEANALYVRTADRLRRMAANAANIAASNARARAAGIKE